MLERGFVMKIADRILLTVYSLLVGLLSLLLIFVPFSGVATNWTTSLFKNYRLDWQNVIIPIFFLGGSVRFLVSGLKRRNGRGHSLIRHTAFGEINISLDAIEGMAQRSARAIIGLRDIKAKAHLVDDGIVINLTALALSDINIPEASVKVQQSIKGYVEECTGVSVKEIKVRINNLANPNKGRVE